MGYLYMLFAVSSNAVKGYCGKKTSSYTTPETTGSNSGNKYYCVITQKYGTTYSIMDYARFNYVAQPEDKGVGHAPSRVAAESR